MKATGIVRKIDELGRVVVPKEIRRTLRIREGDPLEIFTGREGEIILKKYSPIGELSEFATRFAEALYQTVGHSVYITDLDQVTAASGMGKKEVLNRSLTIPFEKIMKSRSQILIKQEEKHFSDICENIKNEAKAMIVTPIISDSDMIGSIVILQNSGKTMVGELEMKLSCVGAIYLGSQMEQ